MESEVYIAQDHINLEHDFAELCMHHGYKVADLSYHHNLPYHTKEILRSSNTHASLSVRLSPDIIIVKDGQSLLCELKTGNNKNLLRVEAYQLMLNQIGETCSDIPCLYVYSGAISQGNIIACRANKIKISSLAIPDRKSNSLIEDTLLDYYEGYPLTRPTVNYPYSGDPYVVIPSDEVEKWETIDKFIQ